MRVEVAVHSVLRNHSVAESTFVRTAALRRRQLRPHVSCITQLRAPERLQSRRIQRKQYIIHSLNNPYTHVEVSVAFRKTRPCRHTGLHKYSTTIKAKGYSQVFNYLTIYVFNRTVTQASSIMNACVDVIQGKNHATKNSETNFKILLHVLHNFFILHLHTSANKNST